MVGDARSYIANSHEQFDVVLASLIDTWAASSAGAFALTENLLYTTDAFRDYYAHLSADGILSISRWHPFETPRLLATALAAWQQAGAADPRAARSADPHAAARGRQGAGLDAADEEEPLQRTRSCGRSSASAARRGCCSPSHRIASATPSCATTSRGGAEAVVRAWTCARPPTNARSSSTWCGLRPSCCACSGSARAGRFEENSFQGNLSATRSLIHLLGAVCLLLGVHRLRAAAAARRAVRRPGWLPILGYFACLGLGFIVIEIGLLQRLILLLGKPIYALAAILSTMLLASGCGSFAAGKLDPQRLTARLACCSPASAVLLVAYAFFLPALIGALLGSPFAVRLVGSVALVAVPGFLLGMPFPSGIRALELAGERGLVPWVWGINGAMSVMASVTAIILAIELGYTAVFLLGAACYGLAALLLRRWPTRRRSTGRPRFSASGALVLAQPCAGLGGGARVAARPPDGERALLRDGGVGRAAVRDLRRGERLERARRGPASRVRVTPRSRARARRRAARPGPRAAACQRACTRTSSSPRARSSCSCAIASDRAPRRAASAPASGVPHRCGPARSRQQARGRPEVERRTPRVTLLQPQLTRQHVQTLSGRRARAARRAPTARASSLRPASRGARPASRRAAPGRDPARGRGGALRWPLASARARSPASPSRSSRLVDAHL